MVRLFVASILATASAFAPDGETALFTAAGAVIAEESPAA